MSSWVAPLQGGGLQPSIGCLLETATGATPSAEETPSERAAALAWSVTELIPNSFVNTAGASLPTRTEIVSFGYLSLETTMSLAETPAPFASAYRSASAAAVTGSSGSACAPASAAASAVACSERCWRYQLARSIESPANPISATSPTTTKTNT